MGRYPSAPPNLESLNSQTPVGTGTEGAIESVRIKRVEFRENVMAFFSKGQSRLSIITSCPYQAGVRKAGFAQRRSTSEKCPNFDNL